MTQRVSLSPGAIQCVVLSCVTVNCLLTIQDNINILSLPLCIIHVGYILAYIFINLRNRLSRNRIQILRVKVQHRYYMRVSKEFKTYNFLGIIDIRTTKLTHSFSKNSHIDKCMHVHTHTIFPMCVINTRLKTESLLPARGLPHALSQPRQNLLKYVHKFLHRLFLLSKREAQFLSS